MVRSPPLALVTLVALPLVSCGARNASNYTEAARAAAFGVGGAAVSRAVNDACWGDCVMGTICNRKTGFCEQAPEPDKRPAAPPAVSASAVSASAASASAAPPRRPDPVPLPDATRVCSPPCAADERCVPDARGENVCEATGASGSGDPVPGE